MPTTQKLDFPAHLKHIDFKIVELIIKLCQLTNTWINAYGGVRNIELECSLLDFVELYKNRILTDYRVFEYAENEVELEFHDAIDKLNSRDRGKYEVEHHFMASLSGK